MADGVGNDRGGTGMRGTARCARTGVGLFLSCGFIGRRAGREPHSNPAPASGACRASYRKIWRVHGGGWGKGREGGARATRGRGTNRSAPPPRPGRVVLLASDVERGSAIGECGAALMPAPRSRRRRAMDALPLKQALRAPSAQPSFVVARRCPPSSSSRRTMASRLRLQNEASDSRPPHPSPRRCRRPSGGRRLWSTSTLSA
jgi:hypothetical protein